MDDRRGRKGHSLSLKDHQLSRCRRVGWVRTLAAAGWRGRPGHTGLRSVPLPGGAPA
ncbi:hypothetical protein F750_6919 [Streptomyces sp. PAMC 26508]|nr:hypothetical protein F750_6919 [Streptomyces sp. PAMC 26508]